MPGEAGLSTCCQGLTMPHGGDVKITSDERAAIGSIALRSNPALLGAVVLTSLSILAAVYLPGLETVLESAVLTARDWGVALTCALVPVIFIEIVKRLWSPRER